MALSRPRLSFRSSLLVDGAAFWLWRHRSEASAVVRSLPSVIRRARQGEVKGALADVRPVAAQARSIDRSRQAIKGERLGLADRVSRLRSSGKARPPSHLSDMSDAEPV